MKGKTVAPGNPARASRKANAGRGALSRAGHRQQADRARQADPLDVAARTPVRLDGEIAIDG
jgi:hypothetical protein